MLCCVLDNAHWARKFKKVQAKKLVISNKPKKFLREIAFWAVLNFFPVQKFIFGHIWNWKKNGFWSKKNREIDLFNFTSIFGLDFLKFSGPLCYGAILVRGSSDYCCCCHLITVRLSHNKQLRREDDDN